MNTRKFLGKIGCFLREATEGGKRALDTCGYDEKALDEKVKEQERLDNERWHRVNRWCAIDQQERHDAGQ